MIAWLNFVCLGVEYVMVMPEGRDLILRLGQDGAEYRERTPAFVPGRSE